MYDDLARTQRPSPLEWFVVNAVIPTLVVTLALQVTALRRASPPTNPADDDVRGYALFGDQPVEVLSVPDGDLPFPEPYRCAESAFLDYDETPVILRWTRAGDAAHLLHADVAGCVVLEGAVGPLGLVDPRSIVVVRATHRRLVLTARQTIIAHLRIIAVGWRPMPARVRVPFEFSVKE